MNKDYAGSSIEFRAKKLLSSIQGNCPDMVWQEVNAELEAKRTKANERWLNKFNTPRVSILVTGIIAVVTLASWKFIFSNKSTVATNQVVYQTPPPPKPMVIVNTPPAVIAQPKKDSVPATTVSTPVVTQTNTPVNSQAVQLAVNANANKAYPTPKTVVKDKGPMSSRTDSTYGSTEKNGHASLNLGQADTTFTMHRSGMVPTSSGSGAVQDTAVN